LLDAAQEICARRSILLTNAMRGTPYLFICRHTVSDCGCTPETAQYTADGGIQHPETALHFDGEVDVTRRVDDIDAVFGKFLSIPFQKQVVAAAVMVMPRSCSCSM